MSYQPPYGAPQYPPQGQPAYGYPAQGQQYPPQGQQYPPPQGQQYPPPQGQPYPPPQGQPYGAPQQYPPPQGQAPYGAPSQSPYPPPQGQTPYGVAANYAPPQGQPTYGAPSQYPPPQGQQYPPQGQQYPPQQGQPAYGAPVHSTYPPAQQGYGPPPGPYTQPTPPSMGYQIPPPHIAWDATADADGLRKAMKGFGTDERTLISILSNKDPYQVALIRQVYNQRHRRTLESDVASEVSGYFEEGLLALIRGPLQQDVYILHRAMAGPGTKESVLNDVLLARSNADIAAIKRQFQTTYHQSLESMVRGDLSMKTERHFMMVLAGNRAEDSAPVIPQQIDQDVLELYKATEGKVGTDELLVCSILSTRNDAQIRSIALAYEGKFRRSLETVIRKEFSGHMETALLAQLRAGKDRVMRDAELLEDAMAGAGTKDELLVNRVIRFHWDRNHIHQVKAAYKQKYHRDLGGKIRGETSGNYEKLMLACIGE